MCDASIRVFGCENWLMTNAMIEKLQPSRVSWPRNPQVAQAILKYCGCHHAGTSISALYDLGEEAEHFVQTKRSTILIKC